MKRYVFLFLAVVILIGVLAACKGKENTPKADTDSVNAPTNTSGDITTESTDEIITTTEPTTTTTTQKSSKTTTTTTTKKADKTTTTTAYKPRPKNPDKLSAAQEKAIKEAWVKGYVNPEQQNNADAVKIKYYGTYNGAAALRIYDNYYSYPSVEAKLDIGGVKFSVADGPEFLVWHNGKFVKLESAYKQGLLTQRDLKDIKYYFEMKNT